MAAEVSAPLSRLDKIVMLNGNCSNARCDAAELLADLPTAVQTITGVDISQVCIRICLFWRLFFNGEVRSFGNKQFKTFNLF